MWENWHFGQTWFSKSVCAPITIYLLSTVRFCLSVDLSIYLFVYLSTLFSAVNPIIISHSEISDHLDWSTHIYIYIPYSPPARWGYLFKKCNPFTPSLLHSFLRPLLPVGLAWTWTPDRQLGHAWSRTLSGAPDAAGHAWTWTIWTHAGENARKNIGIDASKYIWIDVR